MNYSHVLAHDVASRKGTFTSSLAIEIVLGIVVAAFVLLIVFFAWKRRHR